MRTQGRARQAWWHAKRYRVGARPALRHALAALHAHAPTCAPRLPSCSHPATLPAKNSRPLPHLQVQLLPQALGEQRLEVCLCLLHAAPVGQAPALRQAVNVGVYGKCRLPKGLAHDHAARVRREGGGGGAGGGAGGAGRLSRGGRRGWAAEQRGQAERPSFSFGPAQQPCSRVAVPAHPNRHTPSTDDIGAQAASQPKPTWRSCGPRPAAPPAPPCLPAPAPHGAPPASFGRGQAGKGTQGKQVGHLLEQRGRSRPTRHARGTGRRAGAGGGRHTRHAQRPGSRAALAAPPTWLMAFRFLALVGASPSVRMQAAMSARSAAAMAAASGARANSAGVHSLTFLSVVCVNGLSAATGESGAELGGRAKPSSSNHGGGGLRCAATHPPHASACQQCCQLPRLHPRTPRQQRTPLPHPLTCALSSTAHSSWKWLPWSSGMGGLGYSAPSSSAMRPALNSSALRLPSTSCTGGRAAGGGERWRHAAPGACLRLAPLNVCCTAVALAFHPAPERAPAAPAHSSSSCQAVWLPLPPQLPVSRQHPLRRRRHLLALPPWWRAQPRLSAAAAGRAWWAAHRLPPHRAAPPLQPLPEASWLVLPWCRCAGPPKLTRGGSLPAARRVAAAGGGRAGSGGTGVRWVAAAPGD